MLREYIQNVYRVAENIYECIYIFGIFNITFIYIRPLQFHATATTIAEQNIAIYKVTEKSLREIEFTLISSFLFLHTSRQASGFWFVSFSRRIKWRFEFDMQIEDYSAQLFYSFASYL